METAVPPVVAKFAPSAYQQGVFDFVVHGRGDAMVDAVAGSGKTTTLEQAARLLRTHSAMFFAFNKHIAVELGDRLQGTGMRATTIHSYGYRALLRALGKLRVDETKYKLLAKQFVEMNLERQLAVQMHTKDGREVIKARIRGLEELCQKARLTLTDPRDEEGLRGLIHKYGIVLDNEASEALVVAGVDKVLTQGVIAAHRDKVVDFTDMIWLPVELEFDRELDKYQWVFCDEAQDLSACGRVLVLSSTAPGGRRLFVGDARQAIMGFAGADEQSYWAIKQATGAATLPLSICYRCPHSHLELARKIVPHIEDRPGAPEGEVRLLREGQLAGELPEGALVLCRTTAPLVSLCIRLIRQRIPARVRGRNIADQLCDLARLVGSMGGDDQFLEMLYFWRSNQISALSQKEGTDALIEQVEDKVACLEACWMEFSTKTVDDLCREIGSIFSDTRASVWLSTIHRAKGLEADDVTIIRPKLLPFRTKRQTPEQFQQELNLYYVALTRAKRRLTFAYEDGDPLPASPVEDSALLA